MQLVFRHPAQSVNVQERSQKEKRKKQANEERHLDTTASVLIDTQYQGKWILPQWILIMQQLPDEKKRQNGRPYSADEVKWSLHGVSYPPLTLPRVVGKYLTLDSARVGRISKAAGRSGRIESVREKRNKVEQKGQHEWLIDSTALPEGRLEGKISGSGAKHR